ncbi:hypothetical protein [Christiangramia lutea]|nr:hypothetical protein [Christiangramia lutea]
MNKVILIFGMDPCPISCRKSKNEAEKNMVNKAYGYSEFRNI